MSLTKQDIQTIRVVFKEEIRKEISATESRLEKNIQQLQLEMRQLFKQQRVYIIKAITDPLKTYGYMPSDKCGIYGSPA